MEAKIIEIAKQHKEVSVRDFGYLPSPMEVAQHVWHNISVDDRVKIMDTAGKSTSINSRYKNCLKVIANSIY